ncbi:MAG: UvrD-helicase domain-containing protein, partial [Campylobacterales bacterium]|nr:UvrD-helicase domain-containing protein [Campylobacterales bacterium]
MNQFVPYLAVEASAGSGKTFTLAIRYISLLFLDVDPRKILALTFTNKASGEMNERIINILFDLENREIELVELVKNTGISKAKILEKKDDVLEKFLAINSKIMTIDKFFNQILRTFSLYVGLMPDFEITEEDENELFKEFLKELDEKNLLSDLVYLSVIEDMKETKITEIYRTLHDKKINSEYEKIDYSLKGYLETEIEKVLGNMKSFIENCPNNTKAMNSAFDVSSIEELA